MNHDCLRVHPWVATRFASCIAALALLTAIPAGAEMVAIEPAQDNTIFSRSIDASNALGILFTSTTNQNNRRRALLSFDVAGNIPPGSTIISASLTLTLDEAAGDGLNLDHDLHRLLQGWGEGTSSGSGGNGAAATPGDATWGWRFYPDIPWATPGGEFVSDASASAVVGDELGPITWGSTPGMVADVQAWLDSPEINHGWIVVGEEQVLGTARKFVNRESGEQSARPVLVVEFVPPEHAYFQVSKTFSDGYEGEVAVTLSCNTGLPLEQTATINGGGAGVNFVVTGIQAPGANCGVSEVLGPNGYLPEYDGGAGCQWEGVTVGQFDCAIENLAQPATFTVAKQWILPGAAGQGPPLQAFVSVLCNNPIAGGFFNGGEYQYDALLVGEIDAVEVSVDTLYRSAACRAEESQVENGVERDSDCNHRVIPAGGGSSCTIVNTVLFEGIPVLGIRGLGLMALLMLAIGVFAARRVT